MGWQAVGEEVELHSGVPEGEGAHAARTVVEQLGAAMLDADRREILHLLPEWLRDAVGSATHGGDLHVDGLYRRVAARLGVAVPQAVEVTKLVCASVTHRMEDDVVRVLKTHLPEDVAALLVDRPHEFSTPIHARPPSVPPPGEGHTLSSGKPGSHASLSVERPGSDHPVSEDD